jgi:hypothetical protein
MDGGIPRLLEGEPPWAQQSVLGLPPATGGPSAEPSLQHDRVHVGKTGVPPFNTARRAHLPLFLNCPRDLRPSAAMAYDRRLPWQGMCRRDPTEYPHLCALLDAFEALGKSMQSPSPKFPRRLTLPSEATHAAFDTHL